MTTLIKRLEVLTGPSREVDAEIFETIHGRKPHKSVFEQYEPSEKVPYFTASLDVAMTLVPENFEYEIGSARLVGLYWAHLISARSDLKVKHINQVIALCIAALKAREFDAD